MGCLQLHRLVLQAARIGPALPTTWPWDLLSCVEVPECSAEYDGWDCGVELTGDLEECEIKIPELPELGRETIGIVDHVEVSGWRLCRMALREVRSFCATPADGLE